jgi:hypothetical protein
MADKIVFFEKDYYSKLELFKNIIANNLVFSTRSLKHINQLELKTNKLYLCYPTNLTYKINKNSLYEEIKFTEICAFYYNITYSKKLIETLKNEHPELIKIFYFTQDIINPNLEPIEFNDNLYSYGLSSYEMRRHLKYRDYFYFSKKKQEKTFTFTFIPSINTPTEYDPDTTLLQSPKNTNTVIDKFITNINLINYALEITKINDIYIDSHKLHLFDDIFYLNSDYLYQKKTINFKFITILSEKENDKILIKYIHYSELKYHKINTDFFLYHNIDNKIKIKHSDGIVNIIFNKPIPVFKEPPSKKKNIIIYI